MPRSVRSGASHGNWKGGRIVQSSGYVQAYAPDHPRATRKYVHEHVLVVETALGKALPRDAQIHHRNGKRADNQGTNLIVCQSEQYHRLIHQRERAYRATGDPAARSCCRCFKYGGEIAIIKSGQAYHRACEAAYRLRLYRERRQCRA